MSLTELEVRRQQMIRALVDHPDFDAIMKSIKLDIAYEMVNSEDPITREEKYLESKMVDMFRGRLVKLANDVRMIEHA